MEGSGNLAVSVTCYFLEKTNMTFEAIMLTSLILSLLTVHLPLCESSSMGLTWIPRSRTEGSSCSPVWAQCHSTPRCFQLLLRQCFVWPIFMSGTWKRLDRPLYQILKLMALCMCSDRDRTRGRDNSTARASHRDGALLHLIWHQTRHILVFGL